ncbi:MAG: hypothetical protein U0230_19420 [Polyangiales bacterium]
MAAGNSTNGSNGGALRRVRRACLAGATVLAGLGAGCDDGGTTGSSGPQGPVEVTVRTFAPIEANASWVAYQDGDGPWQVVDGLGGRYVFPIASGRYGVAIVCAPTEPGASTSATVVHALVTEADTLRARCTTAAHDASVKGQVVGLAMGDDVAVSFATGSGYPTSTTPTFTAKLVTGTTDVVMRRRNGALVDYAIERALSFGNGSQWAASVASAVPGASGSATVTGALAADAPFLAGWFTTAGGVTVGTYASSLEAWSGPPASLLAPNDVQAARVNAGSPNTDAGRRSAIAYVHEVADVELALPSPVAGPTVLVVAKAPYVRLSAEFPDVAGDAVFSLYHRVAGGASRSWDERITTGYLEATGAATFETTSLSGLPGFDDAWGIASGGTVTWLSSVATSNRGPAGVLASSSVEEGAPPTGAEPGLVVTDVQRSGQVVP